jgi:hypothetical protein
MPAYSWMNDKNLSRDFVRRTRGRRRNDRLPSLEIVLTAGVIVAWGWGGYELAQLFLH